MNPQLDQYLSVFRIGKQYGSKIGPISNIVIRFWPILGFILYTYFNIRTKIGPIMGSYCEALLIMAMTLSRNWSNIGYEFKYNIKYWPILGFILFAYFDKRTNIGPIMGSYCEALLIMAITLGRNWSNIGFEFK